MSAHPVQRPDILRAVCFLLLAGVCTLCLIAAYSAAKTEPASLAEPKDVPLSARISNYDQVISDIRHGLHDHAAYITVSFSYSENIQKELTAVVADWMEEALEETDDPAEGDYIRYQSGGYEIACTCKPAAEGRYQYTVKITPEHYTYLAQEEEVSAAIAELEESFGFTAETSEYEKISAIYSWVCDHVKYDAVHRNNDHAHLRSTAYAAVIWRTAACQGYSVTLYRLLREAGIGCRVVTGTAQKVDSSPEFHAWNIVELEGKWYHLDATWDAGRENWDYFLRGSESLTDHTLGKSFVDKGFASRYAISETDHPDRSITLG